MHSRDRFQDAEPQFPQFWTIRIRAFNFLTQLSYFSEFFVHVRSLRGCAHYLQSVPALTTPDKLPGIAATVSPIRLPRSGFGSAGSMLVIMT
jgi:hypothetical protein